MGLTDDSDEDDVADERAEEAPHLTTWQVCRTERLVPILSVGKMVLEECRVHGDWCQWCAARTEEIRPERHLTCT